MKNYIISTLLLVIPMLSFADVVEIDGIYYNLIPKGKVAEVTKKSSGYYYGDIVIPESVTYENIEYSVSKIGRSAFSDCMRLNSVTIPNTVTTIEDYAFYWCTSMTAVTIPNSVTTIGEGAFNNCSSLNSVTIPNSVTSIGNSAFCDCRGLTSVTIPNSVTSIGPGVFNGCKGLTSVAFSNSITTIESSAFKYCIGLTSIVIPSSVTAIKDEAFYGCKSLTSVTFPNSLTSIGISSFKNCSGLTSLSVPNSIISIKNDAFSGCDGLVAIHISDLECWCNISFSSRASNPLFYAKHLYLNNSEITDLIIPNGIKRIRSNAFVNCKNIKSLVFTNSITSIGSSAFLSCSSLSSVDIPNSVTKIGDFAFSFCSGLTSITIPSTVEDIGESAFQGCSSLIAIEIPENLKTIEMGTFQDCTNLKEIIIPNSVTRIKGLAFKGCENLTKVSIGKSVTMIGINDIVSQVFSSCSNLSDVYCYAEKVPYTDSKSFDGSYIGYATLHVPANSVEVYKSTAPWSNFGTIVAIEVPKHTLAYTVDGTTYKTYTIEEGETVSAEAEPTKEGYTFSGWSEIPETMPASDVTITGTFTINKYKLTYTVDGEEYKASDVEYGTKITPEAAPTKEGYTFSGWSEIPETMPANDVNISGTFTINKYTITYIIDGEVFKSMEVEYNSVITPPDAPAQEGYDFAWTDFPETMPASDITIYGTYTTGISSLSMEESDRQVFTPDGKRVETPKKGLNIIRMSDGTVKKVVVK